MGKVIFIDVDGTLLDYENKLPASVDRAIKEARKNGLKKKYVKHFKNVSKAKKYILSIIKPKDNVLIKASNAINLSELVNYLKKSEIDN